MQMQLAPRIGVSNSLVSSRCPLRIWWYLRGVVLLVVAVLATGHINTTKKLSRNNIREEFTLADSLGR